MSKVAISGVSWGNKLVEGITAKEFRDRIDVAIKAEADRQRAADLLARGVARSQRNRDNSLGLGE